MKVYKKYKYGIKELKNKYGFEIHLSLEDIEKLHPFSKSWIEITPAPEDFEKDHEFDNGGLPIHGVGLNGYIKYIKEKRDERK